MMTVTSFIFILLVGACVATPTKEMYERFSIKYGSGSEVLYVFISDEEDLPTFFVEADVDKKGNRVYKGVYSIKDEKAKKILENGRDIAASADHSQQVFFGASDGIYKYNKKDDSAVKYGSVVDSVIGIATEKSGDVIYILTDDHVVYKVSGNGNKKEKLEDIVDAKQIVIDSADNLYFFSDDKIPYVRSAEGVKKIKGLPANPSSVEFFRPLYLQNGASFVSDTDVYMLYADGTSIRYGNEIKPEVRPSAYAPDGAYVQYFARGKTLYKYNALKWMINCVQEGLTHLLRMKAEDIRLSASIQYSNRLIVN